MDIEKNYRENLQSISKEINGCLVHLSFTQKPDSEIQKKIEYILTDVFEKRIFGNTAI